MVPPLCGATKIMEWYKTPRHSNKPPINSSVRYYHPSPLHSALSPSTPLPESPIIFPPLYNTNTAATPHATATPALTTTFPPALGIAVGCAVSVPFAPPPVPLAPPPPPPPAPPVEDPDTAVSTAAEQGVVGASVRVTTSGAAGVDDGQVEHVIVDSARAVSWRAIEWVSGLVLAVSSWGMCYERKGEVPERRAARMTSFIVAVCWFGLLVAFGV